MEIIVDPDKVMVEGQTIYRPSYMAVSEWMEYWEWFQKYLRDKK